MEQDCLGRCPIRASVAYESDYNVIEYMFHNYPNAILQQCNDRNNHNDDVIGNGNTPLHIAMNGYKQTSFKHRNDITTESCQEYYLRIIKLFIKEVPLSLTISNINGITPLQLAKELNISLQLNNNNDNDNSTKTRKTPKSESAALIGKNNRFRQISFDILFQNIFFHHRSIKRRSHHRSIKRRRSIAVDTTTTVY